MYLSFITYENILGIFVSIPHAKGILVIFYSLSIVMANTRFKYDQSRTSKKLQEVNDTENYILNTPGNGTNPTYIADPHVIPQKWGGNLSTNPIEIESSLRGISQPLRRGDSVISTNPNILNTTPTYPINNIEFTMDQRYITPAWEIRNAPITRWDYLPTNPQLHSTMKFSNNMNTRNTVKDYYLYKV